MLIEQIKQKIRHIPDYPIPGVNYFDLTPLFSDPDSFCTVIDELSKVIIHIKPDKLVAIEARGFIIGAALAGRLRLPFVPVRKPGKLPADKIGITYDLEYGQDTLEIHTDAIQPRDRTIIVDDILATGGTMQATCQLVEQLGGEVCAIAAIVALTFLPFKETLAGYNIHYLIEYTN